MTAQDPVLQFIMDYVAEHGRGPDAATIRAFVDFTQPGPIGRLLGALERLGEITAARRAERKK